MLHKKLSHLIIAFLGLAKNSIACIICILFTLFLPFSFYLFVGPFFRGLSANWIAFIGSYYFAIYFQIYLPLGRPLSSMGVQLRVSMKTGRNDCQFRSWGRKVAQVLQNWSRTEPLTWRLFLSIFSILFSAKFVIIIFIFCFCFFL